MGEYRPMTGVEIARLAGITRQRVSQLLARGEEPESIIAGTYHRRPAAATRCAGCSRTLAFIKRNGHKKRCPYRPGVTSETIGRYRCGACGEIGHNRRSCTKAP